MSDTQNQAAFWRLGSPRDNPVSYAELTICFAALLPSALSHPTLYAFIPDLAHSTFVGEECDCPLDQVKLVSYNLDGLKPAGLGGHQNIPTWKPGDFKVRII
jgi:hypothetical protein